MKRTMIAALSIILVLFAFAACSNDSGNPGYTGNTSELATEIKPADIVNDVLDPDAEGVIVTYTLAEDSTRALTNGGSYTLTARVEFESFDVGNNTITGGVLIYEFKGTVTNGRFTATSTCSVTTESPLVIETAEGAAEMTINDEEATVSTFSITVSDVGPVDNVTAAITVTISTTNTVTIDGDEVTIPKPDTEPEEPTGPVYTSISTVEELDTALATGGYYRLANDITYSSPTQLKEHMILNDDTQQFESDGSYEISENITLDLNGKKLTSTVCLSVVDASAVISNGTLEMTITGIENPKYRPSLRLCEDSALTFDAVDYTSNIVAVFFYNNENNATLRVTNGSTVKTSEAYYAIGTNASEPPEPSQSMVLEVIDSSVISAGSEGTNGDNTAILFNVNGTVTIDNSTIRGDRHGLILRGGKEGASHRISNSTIEATGIKETFNEESSGYPYISNNWASGNGVPQAALVIGNRTASSYRHDISVELQNADINGLEHSYCDIYVWENHVEGYDQTVTVMGFCKDTTYVNAVMNGADFNVSNTAGAIYSLDSTINYSSIKDMIESTLYAGIEGSGTATINVDEPINLARSFSFDSIIFDGEQTGQQPDEDPIGINLSGSRDDITITIENSEFKNFGYAISSNKANGNQVANGTVYDGSLTLTLDNTDFDNCYKGLYATDIKNLTIDGGTFSDMGTAATSTGDNVVKRSGAAIDINQMYAGGEDIVIRNAEFTNCGGTEDNDETTSGAIKVKVRGGDDDIASDIPNKDNFTGSLESLTVENCTFSENRMDVVLGTSQYASTDDFDFSNIQSQPDCKIENNAGSTTLN